MTRTRADAPVPIPNPRATPSKSARGSELVPGALRDEVPPRCCESVAPSW